MHIPCDAILIIDEFLDMVDKLEDSWDEFNASPLVFNSDSTRPLRRSLADLPDTILHLGYRWCNVDRSQYSIEVRHSPEIGTLVCRKKAGDQDSTTEITIPPEISWLISNRADLPKENPWQANAAIRKKLTELRSAVLISILGDWTFSPDFSTAIINGITLILKPVEQRVVEMLYYRLIWGNPIVQKEEILEIAHKHGSNATSVRDIFDRKYYKTLVSWVGRYAYRLNVGVTKVPPL